MKITLRKETIDDYDAVFNLIQKAFESESMSDHKEQFLVERLRKSKAFVPELSIVAEVDNQIIGHILLTRLIIKNENAQFDSLALAPVSVLPDFQGKGVGAQLITFAHSKAKELGYTSVVLLGHEHYYPRFGYQPAHLFDIELPFDVPKENSMVLELIPHGLKGVSGVVEYPKEFNE